MIKNLIIAFALLAGIATAKTQQPLRQAQDRPLACRAVALERRPEPLLLGCARGQHALTNGRRGLTRANGSQLLVAHGRHLNMNIYPVEERPGNPVAVVLDLQRRTAAIVF